MMAAKAERDRLQESARMHTEAAQITIEKAEKVRSPTLSGGLGRVIREVLENDPKHIELELYRAYKVGNPLDPGTAEVLGNALLRNNVVRVLDIHCNNIGDDGAVCIATALRVNVFLQNVNMASCGFSDVALFQIGEAMKKNRTLRILNVGNWNLKKEDAEFRNTIGDRGAR